MTGKSSEYTGEHAPRARHHQLLLFDTSPRKTLRFSGSGKSYLPGPGIHPESHPNECWFTGRAVLKQKHPPPTNALRGASQNNPRWRHGITVAKGFKGLRNLQVSNPDESLEIKDTRVCRLHSKYRRISNGFHLLGGLTAQAIAPVRVPFSTTAERRSHIGKGRMGSGHPPPPSTASAHLAVNYCRQPLPAAGSALHPRLCQQHPPGGAQSALPGPLRSSDPRSVPGV